MVLSIVVPVYNEEQTLNEIIGMISEIDWAKEWEMIIIDDGSKDKSATILKELSESDSHIKVFTNEKNLGKTQTVKRGILESKGEYVCIQDADLEYDPKELKSMVDIIRSGDIDILYGNRFGRNNKVIYLQNYIGNRFISLISNIFTFPRIRVWIPDMEVCYKLMRGDVARDVAQNIVSTTNFGLEPEITARLSQYSAEDGKRLKWSTHPITYHARSIENGKKMKAFQDGFYALIEILRFNVFEK